MPVSYYSISAKNVETIRAIPARIQLGQFAGDQTSVTCRGGLIGTMSKESFAIYIREAMNDELIIARGRAGAPTRTITLTGTVKNMDVWCGISQGSWTVEMDLSIDDQPPFTVKTVHAFAGNFFGQAVSRRAQREFFLAVQEFVHDVLTSPTLQAGARH